MIIFDLDGTLWDASAPVAESWNIRIEQVTGKPGWLTSADIAGIMGLTMTQIADKLFSDIAGDERYELMHECEVFENEYISEHGGTLFPEVRETLQKLLDAGAKMAVVSNCQEGYIPAFIKSMKMQKYFVDYEEWGRTHLSKAENIRLVMERNGADKAIYVGDIQKDANSAHEAGIPIIFASYGFGEIKDAEATVRSFDELPGLLKSMGYLQSADDPS